MGGADENLDSLDTCFVDMAGAERPLFHDLLKGFEDYAKLKELSQSPNERLRVINRDFIRDIHHCLLRCSTAQFGGDDALPP